MFSGWAVQTVGGGGSGGGLTAGVAGGSAWSTTGIATQQAGSSSIASPSIYAPVSQSPYTSQSLGPYGEGLDYVPLDTPARRFAGRFGELSGIGDLLNSPCAAAWLTVGVLAVLVIRKRGLL